MITPCILFCNKAKVFKALRTGCTQLSMLLRHVPWLCSHAWKIFLCSYFKTRIIKAINPMLSKNIQSCLAVRRMNLHGL